MNESESPTAAQHNDPFKASFHLGEDLRSKFGADGCPEVRSADDIAGAFQDMAQLNREIMIAGTLDCKCRLTYWNIVSVGCSDKVVIRIGEVFHGAILTHGTGIFLVHNHPSGSLKPSTLDLQLTRDVTKAGQLLGYPLLDHVIVARKGHRSILKLSLPRTGKSSVPASRAKAENLAADAAEGLTA
jgi:DNA repair protein RadC